VFSVFFANPSSPVIGRIDKKSQLFAP